MGNNKQASLPWSCDTFVVLPDSSENRATMLGKNSDRPIFDCQSLMYHSHKKHNTNEYIQLAYIKIPQVEETYATIGSSPYWCWGYEEGINEFGVAIGNEAIFTKDGALIAENEKKGNNYPKGILGMELLRLGLERGKNAREALDVMTSLVHKYGQWGSGVPMANHVDGSYNNSYIIADKDEAWILETAGKEWVARCIRSGYEAISNEPSIRTEWDLSSDKLIEFAISNGWWPKEKEEQFDFAFAYTDFGKPLQLSHIRVQRNRQLLKQSMDQNGKINFNWMKKMLRDHYEDTFLEGPYFNAALPDFLTICMHSSPAGFTWGNTASSAVFILPKDENRLPIMWWTPVTPCTGLYLPIFINGDNLPDILSNVGTAGKQIIPPPDAQEDSYSNKSYWWIFRDLLDCVKGDELGTKYTTRHKVVRAAFDKLELEWYSKVETVEAEAVALRKNGEKERAAKLLSSFTMKCLEEAIAEVNRVKSMIELL